MKPDYKNWVPKGMLAGFAAGLTAALALLMISLFTLPQGAMRTILLAATIWLTMMHRAFSYNGKRQLAKAIVEGTRRMLPFPTAA